jgi:uncharacterized protein YeeX (DUF496 family)
MGKNTGNNTRKGFVKNRSQFYNPKTDLYVVRNDETGKIMRTSKTKFKGIKEINKK